MAWTVRYHTKILEGAPVIREFSDKAVAEKFYDAIAYPPKGRAPDWIQLLDPNGKVWWVDSYTGAAPA